MSTKVYEILREKVLEKLEQGVVPWQKTWKGEMGYPRNIITNKAYSGFNHFMLSCQGYTSPFWMTWKQAKQLKGHIRTEETKNYTMITFWKMNRRTNEDEDGEEKEYKFPIIRYYKVYNLEQTEGITPKWDNVDLKGEDHDPIPACESVVENMREMPDIRWGMNPVYMGDFDEIGMPRMERFNSPEEYYATLFHEMIHSTKNFKRMNRPHPGRAKEELIAEMGALFLCGITGIATKTVENQAAYVKSWVSRIKENDASMVVSAANTAQRCANWILNISEFLESNAA